MGSYFLLDIEFQFLKDQIKLWGCEAKGKSRFWFMIIALEIILPVSILHIDLAFPLDNQWPLRQQHTVARTWLMTTRSRLQTTSWPKLCFSSWTLRWNDPRLLSHETRRTLQQTSELSSRAKEMSYYSFLQQIWPISCQHNPEPTTPSVLWFCPL